MTYPTMEHLPRSIGAGAVYKSSPKLKNIFTKKDKFGEEYVMYRELDSTLIQLPRNCAPPMNEAEAESLYQFCMGPRAYNWTSGFISRDDEQQRLVDESVYELLHGDSLGHIIEAPTGFGKTWVGSAIAQQLGVRPIVITTKEDIFYEWKETLAACLNIDVSLVGEWRGDVTPKDEHQAVVALVQSVCKGPDRYDEALFSGFGLVIVDEVHRIGADEFTKAMWHFPARYRIGLSATPYRKDGREKVFQAHIGEVAVVSEAMPMQFKVICVDTEWEVPIVWQYDPDLNRSVLKPLEIPWGQASRSVKYLKTDDYRNSIISAFTKSAFNKDRHTVVLSDTVEHLEIIHKLLLIEGIPDKDIGYYIGLSNPHYTLPVGDRYTGYKKEVRADHATRPIVLATYKMCGEGTNVPWWDTAILTTPKADVTQPVGRILRQYEGKKFPTVLDLCDYAHEVLATFCGSRRKWYASKGAEIIDK